MPNETPSDRELEALKILWEREEMTVRDLADAMNASAAVAQRRTRLHHRAKPTPGHGAKRLRHPSPRGEGVRVLAEDPAAIDRTAIGEHIPGKSFRRRGRRIPRPRPRIQTLLRCRARSTRSHAHRRPRTLREAPRKGDKK